VRRHDPAYTCQLKIKGPTLLEKRRAFKTSGDGMSRSWVSRPGLNSFAGCRFQTKSPVLARRFGGTARPEGVEGRVTVHPELLQRRGCSEAKHKSPALRQGSGSPAGHRAGHRRSGPRADETPPPACWAVSEPWISSSGTLANQFALDAMLRKTKGACALLSFSPHARPFHSAT
jgi:hypothetical protein